MDMLNIIFIVFLAIISANVMWEFLLLIWHYLHYHNGEEMINKDISLNEFLDNHNEEVKQIVYKIDGNYNGNIKGKNITVILMGDGNINGNINTKDGTVFLNKGNVNGDIKADKVLYPQNNQKDEIKIKPEISNYASLRQVTIRCPRCHNTFNENLRVDISAVDDKIFHTMITPVNTFNQYL